MTTNTARPDCDSNTDVSDSLSEVEGPTPSYGRQGKPLLSVCELHTDGRHTVGAQELLAAVLYCYCCSSDHKSLSLAEKARNPDLPPRWFMDSGVPSQLRRH